VAKTIFQQLIDGDIPSEKVHEDEHCIVIHDIHPQAAVHVLVIPRKPLTGLSDAAQEDEALLGHLLLVAKQVAAKLGTGDAFRVIINNGSAAGQTVFHLHLHVIGNGEFTEDRLV